jgi:hypothetical protein
MAKIITFCATYFLTNLKSILYWSTLPMHLNKCYVYFRIIGTICQHYSLLFEALTTNTNTVRIAHNYT